MHGCVAITISFLSKFPVLRGSVSSSLQLTGWTSNLVDIVMAHHFSTVSFSCSILLTLCFFLHVFNLTV